MPKLNCFSFMSISFLYHYPLSSTGSSCTQLALTVAQYCNCFFSVTLLLSPHIPQLFSFCRAFFRYCSSCSCPLLYSLFSSPNCFLLFHMQYLPLFSPLLSPISASSFTSSSSFSSHLAQLSSLLLSALNSGNCVAFLTMTPRSKVCNKKKKEEEKTFSAVSIATSNPGVPLWGQSDWEALQ